MELFITFRGMTRDEHDKSPVLRVSSCCQELQCIIKGGSYKTGRASDACLGCLLNCFDIAADDLERLSSVSWSTCRLYPIGRLLSSSVGEALSPGSRIWGERGKEKKEREKKKTADCIILHLSRHGNRLGPRRKSALVSIATQGRERKREGRRREGKKLNKMDEMWNEIGGLRKRGGGKKNRFGVRGDQRCRSECRALAFNRLILAKALK